MRSSRGRRGWEL